MGHEKSQNSDKINDCVKNNQSNIEHCLMYVFSITFPFMQI